MYCYIYMIINVIKMYLKILESNTHFAIPILADIVTNNGVQIPVIPNLNP